MGREKTQNCAKRALIGIENSSNQMEDERYGLGAQKAERQKKSAESRKNLSELSHIAAWSCQFAGQILIPVHINGIVSCRTWQFLVPQPLYSRLFNNRDGILGRQREPPRKRLCLANISKNYTLRAPCFRRASSAAVYPRASSNGVLPSPALAFGSAPRSSKRAVNLAVDGNLPSITYS